MDRFIKIACDSDFSQLYINEKNYVLTQELISVWEAIHEEFLDGMKDKAGLHILRLTGKINHLMYTLQSSFQMCVKFLSVAYHPEVVQDLQKHVRVGSF